MEQASSVFYLFPDGCFVKSFLSMFYASNDMHNLTHRLVFMLSSSYKRLLLLCSLAQECVSIKQTNYTRL